MKIRYYFGIGIIYILICLFGIYYLTDYRYQLQLPYFGGIDITLQVGLWVFILLTILFFISLVGMFLIVIKYKFHSLKQGRDYAKIISQIREQMLGEQPKNRVFGDANLKELHNILDKFILVPKITSGPIASDSKNEKIESVFKIFNNIMNGEVQEFRGINISNAHPFFLMNLKNMASSSASNALRVLDQDIQSIDGIRSEGIYKLAWGKILESKNAKMISKAIRLPTALINSEILNDIVRFQARELLLSENDIIECFKRATLSDREYLDIATNLSKAFKEDNISFWLSVFDKLSKLEENSIFSYFYILLSVGKTNEALDLKAQFGKDEYLSVSAFNDLKGKGYPLLLFFEPFKYMHSYKGAKT